MLPTLMRARLKAICGLLVVTVALGACGGEEETSHVVEGEPLELGELAYNVQLTRFLNPDDNEDAEYLVGQPPPDPGSSYLGVFMVILNESEESQLSAGEYTVVDTQDREYSPLESESPYALTIGDLVPAEGELPLPDTTAQTGPNQGALLIFNIADESEENRPLELDIASAAGDGSVELDI